MSIYQKFLKKVLCVSLAALTLGAYAGTALPQYVGTEITANAASEVSFTYIKNGDGTATIVGCSGVGDIVIPEKIDIYTVTAIGYDYSSNSFHNTSIRSIVIPKTVKTIGANTFEGNTGLRSVTLNKGLETIKSSAFKGCTSLKEINIPSTVEVIGDNAFYGCALLEKAVIGDDVTKIGDEAFYNCVRLKNLTIGDSVQKIGNSAFSGCTSLEKVVIPDSVLEMGHSTFSGCTSLKTVKLGTGLSAIPSSCFQSTALSDLPEMQYITVIGYKAFYDCDNLTGFFIPDCVTEIGGFAFEDCDNLKWLVISDTVQKVGTSPSSYGSKIFCDDSSTRLYSFTRNKTLNYYGYDYEIINASDLITLNKTTLTMRNGTSETLAASVSTKFYKDRTVKWSSSNSSVVSVSGGKLTAKKTGQAVITAATVNGIEAKCTVAVKADPTSIKLNKTSTTIDPRKTETLKVTLNPVNAYDVLTWTSSNTKIAKVSNGKITAIGPGTATITAKTNNGKTASCKVTVTTPVSSVKLSKTSLTLPKGASETITTTIAPSNASNKTITWTTSNSSVATVSNGKITAKSNGTATITAKSHNGKTAFCEVTVITPVAPADNGSKLVNNQGQGGNNTSTWINWNNITAKAYFKGEGGWKYKYSYKNDKDNKWVDMTGYITSSSYRLPKFTTAGNYTIRIAAIDKCGQYASKYTFLTVKRNTNTTLRNTSSGLSNTYVSIGQTITANANFTGGVIPYRYKYACKQEGGMWMEIPQWEHDNAIYSTDNRFQFQFLRSGRYTIKIVCRDGAGKTASKDINVTVR